MSAWVREGNEKRALSHRCVAPRERADKSEPKNNESPLVMRPASPVSVALNHPVYTVQARERTSRHSRSDDDLERGTLYLGDCFGVIFAADGRNKKTQLGVFDSVTFSSTLYTYREKRLEKKNKSRARANHRKKKEKLRLPVRRTRIYIACGVE